MHTDDELDGLLNSSGPLSRTTNTSTIGEGADSDAASATDTFGLSVLASEIAQTTPRKPSAVFARKGSHRALWSAGIATLLVGATAGAATAIPGIWSFFSEPAEVAIQKEYFVADSVVANCVIRIRLAPSNIDLGDESMSSTDSGFETDAETATITITDATGLGEDFTLPFVQDRDMITTMMSVPDPKYVPAGEFSQAEFDDVRQFVKSTDWSSIPPLVPEFEIEYLDENGQPTSPDPGSLGTTEAMGQVNAIAEAVQAAGLNANGSATFHALSICTGPAPE